MAIRRACKVDARRPQSNVQGDGVCVEHGVLNCRLSLALFGKLAGELSLVGTCFGFFFEFRFFALATFFCCENPIFF